MRSLRFGYAFVLAPVLALTLGSVASAQATRTWVSGVGDDANPCSRTAPCKTFAGAIAKTAPGGEIDALDPGGFGALTITKSITLDGGGGQVASVLVGATNGIVIAANTANNDVVILRNLRFDGVLGNGSNPASAGLDGVKILSGGTVVLDNLDIFGFNQNGIEVAAGASINVAINNCRIENTTLAGVLVNSSAGTASVSINGLRAYLTFSPIVGNANSSIHVANSDLALGRNGIKESAASSTITVANSQLSHFTTNALIGIAGAKMFVSGTTLAENNVGVNPNGGTISSDGTNVGLGNTSDGSFNGTPVNRF